MTSGDVFTLPTVLHIGVGKTGTTTLQRGFFIPHPQIAYYGQPFHKQTDPEAAPATRLRGYDRATDPRPPAEPFEAAAARAAVAAQADRPDGAEIFVLSDEMLTLPLRDPHETIADRLKALAPDARVMLTLRRQDAALVSLFAMLGDARGDPQAAFDAWLDRALDGDRAGAGEKYRYDRIAEIYGDRFGGVTPFFHEDMRADLDAYIAAIADWLGVAPDFVAVAPEGENRRYTYADQRFMALKARFPRLHDAIRTMPFGLTDKLRALRGALSRRSAPIQFSPSDAALARIAAFYAPGNRLVAQRLGWDLAGRGYPM